MDVDEFSVILESEVIVYVLLGLIALSGIITAFIFIRKKKKSKHKDDEEDKKEEKDTEKKDEKV